MMSQSAFFAMMWIKRTMSQSISSGLPKRTRTHDVRYRLSPSINRPSTVDTRYPHRSTRLLPITNEWIEWPTMNDIFWWERQTSHNIGKRRRPWWLQQFIVWWLVLSWHRSRSSHSYNLGLPFFIDATPCQLFLPFGQESVAPLKPTKRHWKPPIENCMKKRVWLIS